MGASAPKKAKSSEPQERHAPVGASQAPGSSCLAIATTAASFWRAGSPGVSCTDPSQPCAAAIPATTSLTISRSTLRSAGRYARRAARARALAGITFSAGPPSSTPTVSTAGCSGSIRRAAWACRATTIWASASTGSRPWWG